MPVTKSQTRTGRPLRSVTSWTVTMPGCRSWAAARASAIEPRDVLGGLAQVGVRDLERDDPVQPHVVRRARPSRNRRRRPARGAETCRTSSVRPSPPKGGLASGFCRDAAGPMAPAPPAAASSRRIRRQLGIQPRFVQLGKSISVIGDLRRFSLAPPVLDIKEHELAEEKLATRAGGAVKKRLRSAAGAPTSRPSRSRRRSDRFAKAPSRSRRPDRQVLRVGDHREGVSTDPRACE